MTRNHYGTVYVGTHLRFSCSVTLSSSFSPDDVTVNISLVRNASHSNTTPSCVNVGIVDGKYYCGTGFTPVPDQSISGSLWCIAIVDGPNIQTANSSNATHIDVRRKFTFFYLSIWLINPPSLSSISALPPPNVTVSSDVHSVAGQFVELTCAVTVVEEQVKPVFSWTGNSVGSSGVLQNETSVSGATSVRNLTFDPLMTSHGGLYTCRTEIYVLSKLIHTTMNQSHLTVQSEHFMLCFMFLLLFHLSSQGRGDGDCK